MSIFRDYQEVIKVVLEKLKEYKEQKRKYFLKLFEFQEPITFSKEFEENRFDKWQPLYNYNIEEIVDANNLHREVLANELVFDIDADNWNSARQLALNLEEVLNKLQIPFNRWSSGRYLHYHVFLEDKEITTTPNKEFLELVKNHFETILKRKSYTVNDVLQLEREVFKAIGLVILERINPIENAHIDLLKFQSEKALIRAEGSLNFKTRAYKTYLETLPEEQPLIKASWQVKFPTEIKTWKPQPEFYWKLFFFAYRKYIKPKYEIKTEPKPTRKKEKEKLKENKIEWIEKLLENPFSDGRKRLINLVFAPYLTNILNYSEEESIALINDWLSKCQSLYPTRINQTYIRYQVRYAKKRKLLPLSKEKMKEKFGDVEEILKIVGE
jgi:hypothetical protein